MPFDTNGTFTRVLGGANTWAGDAAANTKIRADRHDTNDNDLANGLSECITRTGKTQPTANIPMNSKKLVNLGQPTDDQDAATKRYVDTITGWPTSKFISGADANGQIMFSSFTGTNGIAWNSVNAFWGARIHDPDGDRERDRIVLNNSVTPFAAGGAGGVDVLAIEVDTGTFLLQSAFQTQFNLIHDGTVWRTPQAGTGGYTVNNANQIRKGSNYAATITAYDTPVLEDWWSVTRSTGSVYEALSKQEPTGQTAQIRGMLKDKYRWIIDLASSTTEDETFAGSNFGLHAYKNDGTLNFTVMTAERKTGKVTFPQAISAAFVKASGYAECQGTSGTPNDTQLFNFWYNTSVDIRVYVGTTHVSTLPAPSDYRLKRDVEPLPNCWSKVKALHPVVYRLADYGGEGSIHKADDTERWGFIAHELQEALTPSAASGTKDGQDIQFPDLRTVVAALTSALQEAMARIEALEAKLA